MNKNVNSSNKILYNNIIDRINKLKSNSNDNTNYILNSLLLLILIVIIIFFIYYIITSKKSNNKLKEPPKPVVKEISKPVVKEISKPVVKEISKPVVKEISKPVVKEKSEILCDSHDKKKSKHDNLENEFRFCFYNTDSIEDLCYIF